MYSNTAAMDALYGRYLKLTKNRMLIKSSDTEFTICSLIDNKKLILNYDDIALLEKRIIEFDRIASEICSICDAILEKYIVKFCSEKCYYIFANKNDFSFAMGLKRETIEKLVNYYMTL